MQNNGKKKYNLERHLEQTIAQRDEFLQQWQQSLAIFFRSGFNTIGGITTPTAANSLCTNAVGATSS